MKRRERVRAIGWGLFLLLLTSWPSPPPVPVISGVPDADKGVHLLLYGVEGLLLYRAVSWPGRERFSLLRALAVTGALAVWATADELHQAWIPGREFSAADFAADTAGAAGGAAVASLLSLSRKRTGPGGVPRSGGGPSIS